MTEQTTRSLPPIFKPSSLAIFRTIGYGLLLMAAFNIADIVIPPRLMNPFWEMETAGALIESVPIPLLGLMLIFCGEDALRKSWEGWLTRILSWLCLLCAILFLLLFPLMASNVIRINDVIITRGGNQYQEQMRQIEQIEEQLSQASTRDIQDFLESQGIIIEGLGSTDVKENLLERITLIRKEAREENRTTMDNQRRSVLKNAVKWTIGAFIASFVFAWLWKLTSWARLSVSKARVNKPMVATTRKG